jgi:hypothetical protein
MKQFCTLLSAIAFLSAPFLAAQDSRIISEPAIPPIFTSLDAQLSVDGRGLATADEDRLDTARIQRAGGVA